MTCNKKKRSILDVSPYDRDTSGMISPNPSLKTENEDQFAKLEEIADVTSGKDFDQEQEEREARFFNYWMTTTITTTYTTFTATSSLASVYCTPLGYGNLNCPGNG